jgi:parallel beta-helix repeat protein
MADNPTNSNQKSTINNQNKSQFNNSNNTGNNNVSDSGNITTSTVAPTNNNPNKNNNANNKTQAQQPQQNNNKKIRKKFYIIPIIGIILVAFVFSFPYLHSITSNQSTTTTQTSSNSTTTVASFQSKDLSSCTVINQPGIYTVTGNITTSIKSGSCIEVLSSDVIINGNNYHLKGSGPYIDVAPFTYGILLSGVSNVSINKLNVSRFSYSLYLKNSNNNNLTDLYLSNSTLSNMFLNNSSHNKIINNTIYGSQSNSGGVNINSGTSNLFSGTSFINNAYYGLYVNSTGNNFYGDTFLQNPTDLICGSNANTKNTNNFSKTTCQNNQLCNFATCSSNNYYSIENVKLSKDINTCGAIDSYGTYTILQNLNLSDYTKGASSYPCITITAPNVKLNCNGKTIVSSYYGIYLKDLYNTTVENCDLKYNTYGLFVNGSINTNLFNITATQGNYGVYIKNSTSGLLSNSISNNNQFGVYENQSIGFVIQNVTTSGNLYGQYLDKGNSNVYNKINTKNNLAGDIYCPASTYNSSSVASIYNSSCVSTECQFAFNTCTKQLPPPLQTIPITLCQTISIPGTYQINQNLTSSGSCISIKAPDVKLNCNNKLISGTNNGYGIIDNGNSNVSISDCQIQSYDYGIYASNLNNLDLQNTTISEVSQGSVYKNVTDSSIGNVKISAFRLYGISITNGKQISIENDVASSGLFNATGFALNNVTESKVVGNVGNSNPVYGFSISNSSNDNVSGNKALSNFQQDYYCGAGENLISNKMNINTGIKKSGCPWLVSINPDSTESCFNFANSGFVSFQSDMVYSYGNTCYVINNENGKITNNTVINCRGHTIYATNGGTFANINTTGVTISNCYLVGFTYPIIDSGKGFSLYNTTIMGAKVAVNVSNPDYIKSHNVTVIN